MSKKTIQDKKKSLTSGLWDTVKTIIYALIFALAFRSFIYDPYNVPSGSMLPTLYAGDYMFVNKFTYGYSRYSLFWPFDKIPVEGRLFGRNPDRGDVVVFWNNKIDPGTSQPINVAYVKRVIGLPGDTIQVINGILQVNGKAITRVPDGQKRITVSETGFNSDGSSPASYTAPEYQETLPADKHQKQGVTHPILEAAGDQGMFDNTLAFVVPKGEFFFMGDNRDHSQDSRYLGAMPIENIIGRVSFLFFSKAEDVPLYEFWKWPTSIRWSRLFKNVH